MIRISENPLRYLMVHIRRKSRLAFSSRDALSLIFLAGLPFVMVSSFSINKVVNHNEAYASGRAVEISSSVDAHRSGRMIVAQVRGNPDALLKMNGAQIAEIFSKPGLQRFEGDMGVWQYRTQDCVLDLYIAGKGAGAVVHYETRVRMKASAAVEQPAEAADSRACIRSVFNGHDGIKPLVFASR